jgi:NADH-quinone oxidoreductase subunit H
MRRDRDPDPSIYDVIVMTIPAQILVSVTVALVAFGSLMGAIAYSILLERKMCAWIQDRIGPNRNGPLGLFQPLADGIKLFFKEDYTPTQTDKWVFLLAPACVAIPALIGWAIMPWGGEWIVGDFTIWSWVPIIGGATVTAANQPVYVGAVDVSVGIVYILALTGVGVYGTVLAGWASNSKYAFLGGVRATAQMISYEIPLGIAILVVMLMCGSLRPNEIINEQVAGMWNIVAHPFVAVICFSALLAEAHRAPFDLTEAEQELVGGFHTEYAAMKWALFFFGEYAHLITASAIFTLLFLGGWHLFPFVPQSAEAGLLGVLLKVGVFTGKTAALVVFAMIVRWTLPRFRYDQMMGLAWRILIPTSGLLLVGTAVLIWLGLEQWWWMTVMNAVIFAVVVALQPVLSRKTLPNHRVAMAGSRFSGPPRPASAD